jgi:hypothetical protein
MIAEPRRGNDRIVCMTILRRGGKWTDASLSATTPERDHFCAAGGLRPLQLPQR